MSRVSDVLRFVVIHHPASDQVDLSVFGHTNPGSVWAPYDFWLDYPSGGLTIGRPLKVDGAHVRPDSDHPYITSGKFPLSALMDVNNRSAVGVAVEGNFNDTVPPIGPSDAQLEALAILVGKTLLPLLGIYPYFREDALRQGQGVVPHLDVSRTACPGLHFMRRWADFAGKAKWYYQQWRNMQ